MVPTIKAVDSILDRVVGSDTDLLEDILLIVLLVVLLISMIQPGILVLVVVGAVGSHCSTSVLLFLDREIGSAEDCQQFCCVFFALEELQNVGVHGVLLSKAELIRGKLIFLVDDHGRAVGSQIFLCWLSPFLRSYPFAVELRPGALGASPDALGVLAYNLGFSPAMCPFAGFRLLGNKR